MRSLTRVCLIFLAFLPLRIFGESLSVTNEFRLHEVELGRSQDTELVKVGIAQVPAQPGIDLRFDRGVEILRLGDGRVLTNLQATNLRLVGLTQGLGVNGLFFNQASLILKPRGECFSCQGIRYRGDLIARLTNGKITIVNRIEVEDYLRGVLPHEVNPAWHPEALKAQAIAARSYVLSRALDNKNQLYDVDNTISSQVYKGTLGERDSTDQAIFETRGLVMMHAGKLAVGFFHSSCGGATEDSGDVWSRTLPYLRGKPSEWCAGNPHDSWIVLVGIGELAQALGMTGEIAQIEVRSASPSQRVKTLYLKSSSGQEKLVTGPDFRRALGVNRLKSLLFVPRLRGPWVQIVGRGWGHGVGLCQWCTARMAEAGLDAARILEHFYSGVSILPWRILWPIR